MSRASRGRRLFATAFAVLALSLARPAQAHRVNVFAYVEGDTVHVECSYSRSSRVRSGDIEVKKRRHGQDLPDRENRRYGQFRFPRAGRSPGREGRPVHPVAGRRGPWERLDRQGRRIPCGCAGPGRSFRPIPRRRAGRPGGDHCGARRRPGPPAALDPAALQALVEAAVEKKIAPLRNLLLADKEKGPGLTEIAGGVGYLVGIAGLLAYARSRQGKGRA